MIQFIKEHRGFILLVVLMSVFRSAVADWSDVPTGSMKPTIVEGDRIFINKMAYDLRIPFTHISLNKIADPAYGDIVIFDSNVSNIRLVKRVIGTPGDIVSMKDNQLYINGKAVSYKAIDKSITRTDFIESFNNVDYRVRKSTTKQSFDSFSPIAVPEEHYLVLGDNRDNSADSRFIGFVPRNEIIGRSESIAFSLDYDHYFLPRAGRFFSLLDPH